MTNECLLMEALFIAAALVGTIINRLNQPSADTRRIEALEKRVDEIEAWIDDDEPEDAGKEKRWLP